MPDGDSQGPRGLYFADANWSVTPPRRCGDAHMCREVVELRAEVARLRQGLWDCARESGADTDGQETPAALMSPDIVDYALGEVRQLHDDYDEALSDD